MTQTSTKRYGPPFLTLILPCYNEMEHLERSLKEISAYLRFVFGPESVELILIDDGSTDGTRDFLAKYPQSEACQVHFNAENLGRGGVVKKGLRLAKGKILGFMDVDREVSESYIPRFAQRIEEGWDLVVANRYYPVDATPHSLVRHLTSSTYRVVSKRRLVSPLNDTEAGYKFFSRRAADEILKRSKFDGWFWDSEVVKICEMSQLKLREEPVLFLRDPGKTSTVRLWRDSVDQLKAVRQFKRWVAEGAYK